MDMGQRLGQPHDHPGHAAVAYDEVGADADRKDGDGRIEVAKEPGQVLDGGRPHKPFGGPAGAEPDEIGERATALYRAVQGGNVEAGGAHRNSLASRMQTAKPEAQLGMAPAPRQMNPEPGAVGSRRG